MRIGYARVSANHQNLDRQLATLKAAGCKRIFKEKESGREGVKRPQLEKAIDTLGPGDVLVLAEWDRATGSMLDGIRIIERVAARGATLKALDRQWLDLTHPWERASSHSSRLWPKTSVSVSLPVPMEAGLQRRRGESSWVPSPNSPLIRTGR